MVSKIEEIRAELAGKTGMNSELEADLFDRISQIEVRGSTINPMTKADLIIGLAFAVSMGILPVILVGVGVL